MPAAGGGGKRKREDDKSVVELKAAAAASAAADPAQKGGARRHYKITAKSVHLPGNTHVAFRLNTPSSGAGMPRTRNDGRYRATPLGLSARPLRDKVHYSIEVALRFKEPDGRLPLYLVDVFGPGSTTTTIAKKFVDLKDRVAKQVPYIKNLPFLELVEAEPKEEETHRFRLTLPPFTGFTCDDPLFWTVLRFGDGDGEIQELAKMGSSEKRYGVCNRTGDFMTVESDNIRDVEDAGTLYWGKSQLAARPVANKRTWFTTEFISDWLPQTLTEEKTLDREEAFKALESLLQNGLALLNLDPDILVAVKHTDDGIVYKSVKFPVTAGIRHAVVTVRFGSALRDFFLLDDNNTNGLMAFATSDERTFTLTKKDPPPEDPLRDKYPVHLVAQGQSDAHHFVAGLGWVTLLGLLCKPNKFLGRPEWVEVSAGQTELRLLLVDRWCNPLTVPTTTEFILYLELVDLF